MVQQVQENKGVSFGQVAGATVAGLGVGLGGNSIIRGMNENSRLVEDKLVTQADFSKLAEKVGNNAKEGLETLKQGFETAGDTLKGDTFKDLKDIKVDTSKFSDALKDAKGKEGVYEAAKNAKDELKNIGEQITEKLKEKDIGDETKKGLEAAGDALKNATKDLNTNFSKGMSGISNLSGKQKALVIGAAAIASIGTMMALAPKSKVEEPQHDGMVQGRGQGMVMA